MTGGAKIMRILADVNGKALQIGVPQGSLIFKEVHHFSDLFADSRADCTACNNNEIP